ncbi:MAG: hypothetical protein A3J83_02255 [Elusimicrobia bacterium RIFOXYA2_FULL_40_6]|nr:MAG: hypothetical protein A3J83_02255 [Elusimicrobia bacterium RIFOXYA2_FULL_40_6]
MRRMFMMSIFVLTGIFLFNKPVFAMSCHSNNMDHEGNSTESKHSDTELETSQATIYFCPMHPEVLSQVPGKCPKCGMNLEPKQVTSYRKKSETLDKTIVATSTSVVNLPATTEKNSKDVPKKKSTKSIKKTTTKNTVK